MTVGKVAGDGEKSQSPTRIITDERAYLCVFPRARGIIEFVSDNPISRHDIRSYRSPTGRANEKKNIATDDNEILRICRDFVRAHNNVDSQLLSPSGTQFNPYLQKLLIRPARRTVALYF